MYMSHVANSRENHKASQDTSEWVGNWHNQSIPGKGGQNKQFQYSPQKTKENNFSRFKSGYLIINMAVHVFYYIAKSLIFSEEIV